MKTLKEKSTVSPPPHLVDSLNRDIVDITAKTPSQIAESNIDAKVIIKAVEEAGNENPKYAIVLKLKYLEGHTLKEISRLLNVSHEYIRQLEHQALRYMRNPFFLRRTNLLELA